MGLLVHEVDSASVFPHDDDGEGEEDEDEEQLVPALGRLWFRWSECGREGVVISRAGLEL